jgi:hypothetical protein
VLIRQLDLTVHADPIVSATAVNKKCGTRRFDSDGVTGDGLILVSMPAQVGCEW